MRGIGGAAARRLLLVLALVLVPLAASAQFVSPLEPLDTTSPRDTYLAFRALGGELDAAFTAYEADPSFAGQARLRAVLARTDQLFDLSETPAALRSETGRAAFGSLKDVLMRMPPIDPATLPATRGAPDRVRLPAARSTSSASPRAPTAAPSSSPPTPSPACRSSATASSTTRSSARRPTRAGATSRSASPAPWFPASLTQAIPSWLETLVLGTPAWKIVAAVAAFGLAAWLAALWAVFALRRAAAVAPGPVPALAPHRAGGRLPPRPPRPWLRHRPGRSLRHRLPHRPGRLARRGRHRRRLDGPDADRPRRRDGGRRADLRRPRLRQPPRPPGRPRRRPHRRRLGRHLRRQPSRRAAPRPRRRRRRRRLRPGAGRAVDGGEPLRRRLDLRRPAVPRRRLHHLRRRPGLRAN